MISTRSSGFFAAALRAGAIRPVRTPALVLLRKVCPRAPLGLRSPFGTLRQTVISGGRWVWREAGHVFTARRFPEAKTGQPERKQSYTHGITPTFFTGCPVGDGHPPGGPAEPWISDAAWAAWGKPYIITYPPPGGVFPGTGRSSDKRQRWDVPRMVLRVCLPPLRLSLRME